PSAARDLAVRFSFVLTVISMIASYGAFSGKVQPPGRSHDAEDVDRCGRLCVHAAGGARAAEVRDEARLFRRRPARDVAVAHQVVRAAGKRFGRTPGGETLPQRADGPCAAALRFRAHRSGRSLV